MPPSCFSSDFGREKRAGALKGAEKGFAQVGDSDQGYGPQAAKVTSVPEVLTQANERFGPACGAPSGEISPGQFRLNGASGDWLPSGHIFHSGRKFTFQIRDGFGVLRIHKVATNPSP
jgi:hypothetical protein